MPHMGESQRRRLSGGENSHDMKQHKRTDRVLHMKARANLETSEDRSVRIMYAYLAGGGTPEQRAILAAHYAEVHPSHTERMANCALCEEHAMQAALGVPKLVSSLAKVTAQEPDDDSAPLNREQKRGNKTQSKKLRKGNLMWQGAGRGNPGDWNGGTAPTPSSSERGQK